MSVKKSINLLLMIGIFLFAVPAQAAGASKIDGSDTAWVLISSALVMLMIPAVGLFYGGMVRKKNSLDLDVQLCHPCLDKRPMGAIWL